MKKYTIYCTPEQTKKALELGAPIKAEINYTRTGSQFEGIYNDGKTFYYLPTAEQMLNWLEEQEPIKEIAIYRYERLSRRYWCYDIFDEKGYYLSVEEECFPNRGEGYSTRQEATLAAIDAALEYLISNKK